MRYIFLLALLLLMPISVGAARPPIDAVLVLDVSNSMRNSDPERLAQEAMGLFINMLGKTGDRVGVVAYAGRVTDYLPLMPIYQAEDIAQLQAFINNLGYAGWTDHTQGLDKAFNLLSADSYNERIPLVILLTDGNTEIPPNAARTLSDVYEDLERILAYAVHLGSPIHTIGLNHNGMLNHAYIKNIANITGGRTFETTTAEDLARIMEEILTFQLEIIYEAHPPYTPYTPATPPPAPTPEYTPSPITELLEYTLPPVDYPTGRHVLALITAIFILFVIFLVLIRKNARVFTGQVVVEMSSRPVVRHDLIPYGRRTTLAVLAGDSNASIRKAQGIGLEKIILTPCPASPSFRPALRVVCKHPRILFHKDLREVDAKKGLILSPNTEITIQLPDNTPPIRLKYVT
ncbi:MAG: VWA domain-containing protein [Defluviitaleaceae bacterium]|nr:VWA domain-containing protein [Defluviitaleaceae bacterium]